MAIDPAETSAELLMDLAKALHAAALPVDVVEERLRAVAAGLGVGAQFFTMQSFVAAELHRGGAARVEIRRFPFDTHWNLARTIALNQLAAALAERRLDAAAGRAELARILARESLYPRWLVVLAWAVYGAAVGARVGGRWIEMLVGALISFIAAGLQLAGASYRQVSLEKMFLVASLGTFAAFGLRLVLPPFDYVRALYGGISLIVPSTVVTFAVHELFNEELEAGTVRLVYGIVGFVLLGAGVVAAFSVGKLLGLGPPHTTVTKLPDPVVLGFVALGGLALVPCCEGRREDVPWIVLSAVIAVGSEELTYVIFGVRGAPALAAFILGVAAYFHARVPGRYAITMILPGLRQITPGFFGTRATLDRLVAGQSTSTASFFDVVLLAIQLGLGITAAGLLFKRRRARSARRPRSRALSRAG
jgi:uncharacterized membrane protein YjjP (DUF1212 family)/uncharacterized membrane protein YjjB (DUF3815 family)